MKNVIQINAFKVNGKWQAKVVNPEGISKEGARRIEGELELTLDRVEHGEVGGYSYGCEEDGK